MQVFLEDQTEGLVRSIQSLVGSIRAEDKPATIKDHLSEIATVVGRVVTETQYTTNKSGGTRLRGRAEPIVVTLAGCRAKLLDASVEGDGIRDATAWKDFTKKLPPLAFEVARETKELVQRLDQIADEGNDDDFG